MTSTRVSRRIKAQTKAVYQAFIDPVAVASWLPPGDMRGQVHAYEPWEGGSIRMSLTYPEAKGSPGKTLEDTDTFHGKFARLVPCEEVVWLVEFESDDPAVAGEMKVTWILAEVGTETDVTVLCEDIPAGIPPSDNEQGSQSTLEKLAAFLE